VSSKRRSCKENGPTRSPSRAKKKKKKNSKQYVQAHDIQLRRATCPEEEREEKRGEEKQDLPIASSRISPVPRPGPSAASSRKRPFYIARIPYTVVQYLYGARTNPVTQTRKKARVCVRYGRTVARQGDAMRCVEPLSPQQPERQQGVEQTPSRTAAPLSLASPGLLRYSIRPGVRAVVRCDCPLPRRSAPASFFPSEYGCYWARFIASPKRSAAAGRIQVALRSVGSTSQNCVAKLEAMTSVLRVSPTTQHQIVQYARETKHRKHITVTTWVLSMAER
jgi:hypothetical protein